MVEARTRGAGAAVAPVLGRPDAAEMMASLIRLAPGGRHDGTVPAGSDQYLYVLSGETRLDCDGRGAAALPG